MMKLCLILTLVLILATSAFALEKKAYQMREDFGTEPLYTCTLHYYYFIPCPTFSWFWAFTGWTPGEIIGHCFNIGDQGMGGALPCDPALCHKLEQLRILDFAGYGTVYPGLFTIEFDVYCVYERCCGPMEPMVHLWNSGPVETHYAWNYFPVDTDPGTPEIDPLCLTPCWTPDNFSIVVTATHTGPEGTYPAWGFDNISTALEVGCIMHDIGCLPALYPRNWCGGPDPRVHSGYIGFFPFQYWPPLCFMDGRDTAGEYGCIELAWRIYLWCDGPTATQPSTWGSIKSMYE